MLFEEVDYLREGKNAERFSENFKKVEWVKAPSINWSRSTNKVGYRHTGIDISTYKVNRRSIRLVSFFEGY